MAPPLLSLDGIKLTFGGTPLLDGASLAAGAGDRIALVGRNGSGKSTLLKIAAGMVEPQDGRVFLQPGATVRYLAQEPDWQGFSTVRAYVEAGLGPADDPHRAALMIESLGFPAARRGARHLPACSRPSPTSCCSTSRPTISTSSPSNGWRANCSACAPP
jgi:ATP-binding cassette subfamily F protein uup